MEETDNRGLIEGLEVKEGRRGNSDQAGKEINLIKEKIKKLTSIFTCIISSLSYKKEK